MSRRLGSRLAAAALVLLTAAPAAAVSGVSSPQVTGVEMTTPVRRTLKQIEEQWLQWIVQNSRKDSERVVDDLLATARQLGMRRLPDLSVGAIARAHQAAQQGDFERARWALAAADRLDPGRPAVAFARAYVDRRQGNYFGALGAMLGGAGRIFGVPLERYLFVHSLVMWGLCLLLLTGALFIAIQMVSKGGLLFQDLVAMFSRRLPRMVAVAATVLLLLFPLALPSGLLWLPLFWSVLLWAYSSWSERAVLLSLWLLVGASPVLIASQSREVGVRLSPPDMAMESLVQHRLYGGLFTDLGVLRSLLPESTAVKHFLADVHRSLNQWDLASSLYQQVLEVEPENVAVQMNIGAYAFLKGDFGTAIQHFQKVAAADPANAAAQFNLSQAYSESYLFNESRKALDLARQISNSQVDVWVRNLSQQRVVTPDDGLQRIPEIRSQLMSTYRMQEGASANLELFRRWLSLLVPVVLALLALSIHLARRPFGLTEKVAEPRRQRTRDRWRRILVPGLTSAEAGEGVRSYVSLLAAVGLLILPLFGGLGYRIPWGYDPGNLTAWILAILGILLYFGARLRWELRHDV
ncbi:MAG TPA: tetratricopeptide repeat protein [Thermoanaerobaculia bacterium]|nr:tetratricopeptide repeat protein [Thermoanaerobaculia bacterium]